MTPDRYTTNDVARVAAVTLRQLQWWDENRLLSPAMEGHHRLYTQGEMFTAMLFRELRERGFSLTVIKNIHRKIARQNVTLPHPQRCWLLTNGKEVTMVGEDSLAIALLKERRTPAYSLVSLADVEKRMHEQSALLIQRRGPGRAITLSGKDSRVVQSA